MRDPPVLGIPGSAELQLRFLRTQFAQYRYFFVLLASVCSAQTPGPFFEPEQPFFQAQVEVKPASTASASPGNFVVRGILLPLGASHCALFDQELLRMAGV